MPETNEDISAGGRRKAAPAADATRRFSDRVAHYVKYRPGYPPAVLDHLSARAGLMAASAVADVGSGTGFSSVPFLENGNVVFGVEPNADMRQAAERLLAKYPNFRSIDGTAEATTLPDRSVDLVVAGQAFHWFDPPRAAAEFRRILRPRGRVVLMWNTRKVGGSAFLEDYERLLMEFGTDYAAVRHDRVDEGRFNAFFTAPAERATFPNAQSLDYDGLEGRLLSSSYTPGADDPRRGPMLAELRRLFDRYNVAGRVAIEYDTVVYLGSVG
jgi:SAM-dependent methyltransferase